MAAVIQSIVKQGIERIELRDEILCQLIRQTNDNPDTSSLTLAWLFLCLCTASFSPSKNLHKVRENMLKRVGLYHSTKKSDKNDGERGGLVVESQTPNREVLSSIPTRVTVLCP